MNVSDRQKRVKKGAKIERKNQERNGQTKRERKRQTDRCIERQNCSLAIRSNLSIDEYFYIKLG